MVNTALLQLVENIHIENQLFISSWNDIFISDEELKVLSESLFTRKARAIDVPIQDRGKYMITYARDLANLFTQISLSDNIEVHRLILRHGFSMEESNWILGKSRLVELMEKINSSGKYLIFFKPSYALINLYLFDYLISKIINTLMVISADSGLPLNVKWTSYEINKTLKNFGNREKKGDEIVKSSFDLFVHELKRFEEVSGVDKIAGISLLEYCKKLGTNSGYKNFIIPIFKECSVPMTRDITDAESYRLFYPLYSTLLFENNWPNTESEFRNYPLGEGLSFEQFQVKTLRKFLTKR